MNREIKEFIASHLSFKSSNKKRIEKHQRTIVFGKSEECLKEYSIVIQSFNNISTIYSKVHFKGIYYCSYLIETKRCDSCFISSSGQSGLIEKFIQNDEKLFVLAKKIIEYDSPFLSPKYPELRSQLCICMVTNEYFVEKIENIKKTFLIKIAENRYFLSYFNIGHLFN